MNPFVLLFAPFAFLFVLVPSFLLSRSSPSVTSALGSGLGAFLHAVGFRRRVVMENLRLAFAREKSESEIQDLARKVYRNVGITFLEILRNFTVTREMFREELALSSEDKKKIDSLFAQGKGVLFLSAHYCNWELSAMGMSAHGYPIAVVVKKMNNPISQFLINRVRKNSGLQMIYSGGAVEKMKAALREGKGIGFMMDQNTTGRKGIRVNFFGTPASTIRALSAMVRDTGVPVIPIVAERQSDGTHRARMLEPLSYLKVEDLPQGSKEQIAKEEWINTQAYQNALERLIRAKPECWLWIHRRWKADRTELDPNTAYLQNLV